MDFTKDIYINKDKIREDEDFVILHKGSLFSNNLTNDVYVSYGYGDTWKNKDEKKMKPSTFGYLATIDVGSGDNLQFVFRDDKGNWDNNNSQNYILPIEESQETNNSEEKHHEHKGNANLENTTTSQRKHKIVCKYCKTRFPCTNDNCPHCGAPVEIESLTPECLTPVPHSKEEQTKEISNKEAKTKTTRTKKK